MMPYKMDTQPGSFPRGVGSVPWISRKRRELQGRKGKHVKSNRSLQQSCENRPDRSGRSNFSDLRFAKKRQYERIKKDVIVCHLGVISPMHMQTDQVDTQPGVLPRASDEYLQCQTKEKWVESRRVPYLAVFGHGHVRLDQVDAQPGALRRAPYRNR